VENKLHEKGEKRVQIDRVFLLRSMSPAPEKIPSLLTQEKRKNLGKKGSLFRPQKEKRTEADHSAVLPIPILLGLRRTGGRGRMEKGLAHQQKKKKEGKKEKKTEEEEKYIYLPCPQGVWRGEGGGPNPAAPEEEGEEKKEKKKRCPPPSLPPASKRKGERSTSGPKAKEKKKG